MQKKLIALAVAGLMSGAAFAQANVTVYGVVDAYYANGTANNATNDKFSGINAGGLSGSRIGFKGVEALGNGLSAAFVAELGTLDTTANATANGATQSVSTNGIDGWRQAYVGLTGGFGTAVAGRLQTPGYDFAVKYDAHGASIFSPVGQLSDNAGITISARDALGRLDNAIAYISPNFGGVTMKAAYAFGEQVKGASNTTTAGLGTVDFKAQQTALALSADYDNGPLSVGFVYHDVNNVGGTLTGANGTDLTEWGIGVNYDLGIVKPFASYQKAALDAGVNDDSIKIWNVGIRAPIGAGSIGFAYAKFSDDRNNARTDLVSKSWGLDYQHNLSKRTTAYVGYSRITNNTNTNFTLLNLKGSFAGTTVAAGAGDSSSQYAVGLRHTF
jgi:predicted porin